MTAVLRPADTGSAAPSTDPAATPPAPEESTRRRLWRRSRWPLAGVGAVLLAALAGLWVSGPGGSGLLDPDSYAPDGARALVHVLRDHGVRVDTATTRDGLDHALDAVGTGATVVVTRPDLLLPPRDKDLAASLARAKADVVLVAPADDVLDALDVPVRESGSSPGGLRDPACTDPDARAAGRVLGGGTLYTPRTGEGTSTSDRVTTCYGEASGSSYVVVQGAQRRTTVLGQPALLTNDQLARQGNAALALRAVGRRDAVVWYSPSLGDLPDGQTSLVDLLPSWVGWSLVQLGVALLVVVVWRSRRLGRVVPEPLPVVVRAAETTQGRARLYRRVHGRDRAAAVLRTAAVRRLARRTGLAPGATPHDVVALVAERTGRPAAEVDALLRGGPPADDDSLVRLARALDALETEVRRT